LSAMRLSGRYLLVAALLGVAMVALPAVAGSVEATPSISASNEPGAYGYSKHSWMPSTRTVSLGGAVKFINPYTETYHGLKFTGGSAGEAPKCTGIPAAAGTPTGALGRWEGECMFSKPGTYTFICTVHAEMTGTITVPGTPKAKTTHASGANQTEAMLNGAIEPEGNATEYEFEYGAATVSEHTTPTAGLGATDFASHPVSAALTGLEPGTEYHFQMIATYGAGTIVLGGEQAFTTPAPAAPSAVTTEATGTGQHEATLNGTVDPNGGSATEYFFEFGTTAGYGEKTIPVAGLPADNAHHLASTTASGLQAGTTYHFRLVAKNAVGGPVNGVDGTFKTASSPPPEESLPSSPPANPAPSSTTPVPTTSPLTIVPMRPTTEPLYGSPLLGGPSLRSSQHGSSVHGSIEVSAAGAGGRLEVILLASGASLARAQHRPAAVRVGRFGRSSVRAGAVSFAVPLVSRARSALHRHRRLALTVRIVLTTPASGASVTVTRSVVLHA